MHPLLDVAVALGPASVVLISSIAGARGHYRAAALGGLCGIGLFATVLIVIGILGLQHHSSFAN